MSQRQPNENNGSRKQASGNNVNRTQASGSNLNRAQGSGNNSNRTQASGNNSNRAQMPRNNLNRAQASGNNSNRAQASGNNLNLPQGSRINSTPAQGSGNMQNLNLQQAMSEPQPSTSYQADNILNFGDIPRALQNRNFQYYDMDEPQPSTSRQANLNSNPTQMFGNMQNAHLHFPYMQESQQATSFQENRAMSSPLFMQESVNNLGQIPIYNTRNYLRDDQEEEQQQEQQYVPNNYDNNSASNVTSDYLQRFNHHGRQRPPMHPYRDNSHIRLDYTLNDSTDANHITPTDRYGAIGNHRIPKRPLQMWCNSGDWICIEHLRKICFLCNNLLDHFCEFCSVNIRCVIKLYKKCGVAQGSCSHQFHEHCLQRQFNISRRASCVFDNQPWNLSLLRYNCEPNYLSEQTFAKNNLQLSELFAGACEISPTEISITDMYNPDLCSLCHRSHNSLCRICHDEALAKLQRIFSCTNSTGLCLHVLHTHCLINWLSLKNKCPIDLSEWRTVSVSNERPPL